MIVASLLTGACAALVATLIGCDYGGARRGEVASKIGASVCFVGVGAAHAASAEGSAYAGSILAGLCFGAAADAALLGRAKRAFAAGVALFFTGHLAYITAAATVVSPLAWITPASAVPIAAALVALTHLSPHLESMRWAIALYVAALTTTVIAAIAVALAAPIPGLERAGAYSFAAGAGLFFLSDLAVAQNRLVAPSRPIRSLGRAGYYAGQLLIAWSVAFAGPG